MRGVVTSSAASNVSRSENRSSPDRFAIDLSP